MLTARHRVVIASFGMTTHFPAYKVTMLKTKRLTSLSKICLLSKEASVVILTREWKRGLTIALLRSFVS
jgi:hypothetical protein